MARGRRARRRQLILLTAAVVATPLAACTPAEGPESWPDPAATRPIVDLEFRVAADLATVAGTERVEFMPDLEVCELVLRAWPNKPFTALGGNSLEVVAVSVDGVEIEPDVQPAGAPAEVPGTLVEVPLPQCVAAGATISADLEFELELGEGTDERIGYSRAHEVAWFGTAFPLLAWENGRGWARDSAVRVSGETATSETFALRTLDVVAPSEYEVLGVGERVGAEPEPDGQTRHSFTAPAVRDVAVTVGRLDVVERDVDGVSLYVGAPVSGVRHPLDTWADQVGRSLRSLSEILGPVPYGEVWVSVLPDQSEGVEFAGAIQFGDVSPVREEWLVTHEVAHLWFYGLVGNNQARDPWLDEAFASFAQALADDPGGDPEPTGDYGRLSAGHVGAPMAFWEDFRRPSEAYIEGVYIAGSDALIDARRAAGAGVFDAALRRFLSQNAHEIATPDDVEAAFDEAPGALEVLRRYGAL